MDFMILKCSYCRVIIININNATFLCILIKTSRDLILAEKWMPLSVYICYTNNLSACSYLI